MSDHNNINLENIKFDFLSDKIEKKHVDHSKKYKVLIVDDDEAVHKITKLALKDFMFDHHLIEFHSVYSGLEARNLLLKNTDFAVAFIDVVMESDDSGLNLIKHIRDQLKNDKIRLILRTGQPGKAPEMEIVRNYDINDYKAKTELTVEKLNTALFSALRGYRDIKALDDTKKGLETVIEASTSLYQYHSLQSFLAGILSQVKALYSTQDSFFASKSAELHEGIIVTHDNKKLEIVAATGKYKPYQGGDLSVLIEKEGLESNNVCLELLKDIIAKRDSGNVDEDWIKINEQCFLACHKGFVGSDNYLYMEHGDEGFNESLLKLFLSSSSIILDNYILNERLIKQQNEMIMALGEVIECRDMDTSLHTQRVSGITKVLSQAYGFSDDKVKLMETACMLHDVGKIGIPDSILNKPGKLSTQEFELVKTHTTIGESLLHYSDSVLFELARLIALSHHEKWNGKGYPMGLTGDDIPIEAQIVSIADVFDALTHVRPYKHAWSLDEALTYIYDECGKSFSPKIVELFQSNIDEIIEINQRE